jgi:hypothetical protein
MASQHSEAYSPNLIAKAKAHVKNPCKLRGYISKPYPNGYACCFYPHTDRVMLGPITKIERVSGSTLRGLFHSVLPARPT